MTGPRLLLPLHFQERIDPKWIKWMKILSKVLGVALAIIINVALPLAGIL